MMETPALPNSAGFVALIGAGPGAPGLFTLRGKALLERADVVVYDYLANARLLDHCPAAEKIYVGKKAAQHTMSQEQITQLLVDLGQSGKRVARLKGGDPYIFGRGGEEALALKNAGVRFEVVPGITAAVAAAAYAGIPITHRDFNSGFTILTGHEKEQERDAGAASDLDFLALAKMPCLAFYMGVKALPNLCARLIEAGMSAQTPAATIQWGTLPKQRSIVATVATLAERVREAGIGAPAITIIGSVVSLRDELNWFEARPLFGKTVAVTRTRQQTSELSELLEELGARVIEAPTIELLPMPDLSAVDEALRTAGGYDWIVFTSASGVRFARSRLDELNLDSRAFGKAKLAAIGDATAAAIRTTLALRVDLAPESFVAEALADALAAAGQIAGQRFLLLRAEIARPVLRERIVAGGGTVNDVPIYQTQIVRTLPDEFLETLNAGQLDWITFASSSAAQNLVTLLGPDAVQRLQNVKRASIGPITTATMQRLGIPPTVQAATFNVQGLLDAVAGG